MTTNTETMKKFKFFTSYQKERLWLESMAEEGWLFKDVGMGVFFTFEKSVPKKMMYEVDRFNIPKNPTLKDIQDKELFMDMAQELGWSQVTHDESLTYYFSKEYVEGEINELYNDEESRKHRAKKFSKLSFNKAKEQIICIFALSFLDILIKLIFVKANIHYFDWFDWFTLIYAVICSATSLYLFHTGKVLERELSLSRKEWEEVTDVRTHKKVKKLILTNKSLNKFLHKEASEGYILTKMTPTKYFFEKRNEENQIYTMDSKYLTNIRLKGKNEQCFDSKKDWTGLNSDWQVQSVKDAESLGWKFACALENRAIIYVGTAETPPLNDKKYDNSLRGLSIVGEYGAYLIGCGAIGGIIGFVMALLTF